MPLIRFSASAYCTLLTTSISLNSKIINPCSYYVKKKLVYIIIIALSNCQPSSYFKYTKANIYFLYNMCLMSINKCIFFIFGCLVTLPHPLGINI